MKLRPRILAAGSALLLAGTAATGCGAFNKPIGGRLVRNDWTTLARW